MTQNPWKRASYSWRHGKCPVPHIPFEKNNNKAIQIEHIFLWSTSNSDISSPYLKTIISKIEILLNRPE